MDPKIVKMAKDIPSKLKDVMNSMFEASEPALRSGVSTLRQSLSRLESYLADVEKEHLGGTEKPAGAAGANVGKARPGRRRRRRGARFGTSEFVLNELSQSSKGMRPVEVAEKLAAATGRDRKSALSNINTTLARLKAQGLTRSADGLWTATGRSAPPAGGVRAAAAAGERRRGKGKRAAA